MSGLSFYDLGSDVEAEAIRLKALYTDDGIDHAIHDEFENTVIAYQTQPIPDIITRMRTRYVGQQPPAFGTLAVAQDIDVGMAVWGLKEFQMFDANSREVRIMNGINVSAWILKQHRHRGFGKQLIAHATDAARRQNQYPNLSSYYGQQVWTSIKSENTASRIACQSAGFIEVGIQPDKPGRLLYILDTVV